MAGLISLAAALWWLSGGLEWRQWGSVLIFALAILTWTLTKIEESYVALCAALALVALGAAEPAQLFATLGDSTTWLMLSSFLVAAAVRATGISRDLTWRLAARARSVQHLFLLLAGAIFVTSFLIPATSARAALMLPVYAGLTGQLQDTRLSRALALLIPAIVLLSAFASLTGAGAHLVTADLVNRGTDDAIGFFRWMWLGVPFAPLSSLAAVFAILRLFLTKEERRRAPRLTAPEIAAHPARRFTTLVVLGVIVLWCTEPLHGFPPAVTGLLGALLVTMPGAGAIPLKDALKEVEWGLLLFLAGTLLLSESLSQSAGLEQFMDSTLRQAAAAAWSPAVAVVGCVALGSLLAHLLVHSRTARSAILIPVVIAAGMAAGLNPAALAMLSTAAAGYCLTLPVCAKPVALFSKAEEGFAPRDLAKLSAVLIPVHLALLGVFAFWIWPAQGLSLFAPVPGR